MADLVIQPTRKWIKAQYSAVTLLVAVAVFLYVNYLQGLPAWLLIFPALLYLFPMTGSLKRRFTKVIITGDKLRYETGILSRSTRTIQLSKLQDVRVDQTVAQRLVGIGTVSFETAGETSRLTIPNVDDPHGISDRISEIAQAQQPKRKGEHV